MGVFGGFGGYFGGVFFGFSLESGENGGFLVKIGGLMSLWGV